MAVQGVRTYWQYTTVTPLRNFRDLAHQASFYRSIPSTNLYTFFTSILSVGLQTALSDAILTHSLSLRPPPPLLVTVSDSDIATGHIYT